MELFVIYVLTRLTELKDALSNVSIWMGIAVVLCMAVRLINEHSTKIAQRDDKRETNEELPRDIYIYRRTNDITARGIKLFLPVFLVAFFVNLFLPTTRDALIVAGGYGLTEAVKNERVQRLFNKSTAVASKWIDDQLNGEEASKPAQAASAAASAGTQAATAASAPAVRASEVQPLLQQVKDKVVERVTDRVADEVLGPKAR